MKPSTLIVLFFAISFSNICRDIPLAAQMLSLTEYPVGFQSSCTVGVGSFHPRLESYPQAKTGDWDYETTVADKIRVLKFWKAINGLKIQTAETIYKNILDRARNKKQHPSFETCHITDGLARIYESKHQFEKALELRTAILHAANSKFGKNHWLTVSASVALKRCKTLSKLPNPKLKQLEEALLFFDEALAFPSGYVPPDAQMAWEKLQTIFELSGDSNFDSVAAHWAFIKLYKFDFKLKNRVAAKVQMPKLLLTTEHTFGSHHPVTIEILNLVNRGAFSSDYIESAVDLTIKSDALAHSSLVDAYESSDLISRHLDALTNTANRAAESNNKEIAIPLDPVDDNNDNARNSPAYWAPWVLSGDWR